MYRGIIFVKINSIDSNVIIWLIRTPYLNLTFQSFYVPLLSHRTIHPYTNMHLHIKWFDISCTYVEWKLISLFLSSVYSLSAYLQIFVYELAESAHISIPFQSIVHILYLIYIYLGFIYEWTCNILKILQRFPILLDSQHL